MHTILLLGAYGQNNLGDDALLEVFLDRIGHARLIVNSAQPEQTSARYGVATIATYGSRPRFRRLRALWQADAIVFGGGSLLKEIEGSATQRLLYLLRILAVLAWARLMRRPTAMLAVGMGPLNGRLPCWLARIAAEMADLITVRDRGSRDLLVRLGVRRPIHVAADPALLVAAASHTVQAPDDEPTVVVVPRYSLTDPQLRALAAACDHLVARYGARIVLLPFQTGYRAIYDDATTCRQLIAAMRHPSHAALVVPESPRAALAALRSARLVISARLHGLIFAAASGISPLAIDYEVKVGNFMTELGLSDRCLTPDALAAGRLPDTIDRIWGTVGLDPRTTARVQELTAESEQSFTRFAALLQRTASSTNQRRRLGRSLLVLAGIGVLLLLMWQAAHAKTPTFSHPAQDQARVMVTALRDSEAERAAGAYIPGVGAIFEVDLVRGPNSLHDKPPYWGVHDWCFYLMGTFATQLSAVPPDETIAISVDYYDYENRIFQQFVITSRAGDIADASTYQLWLGGLPFVEAVARIEGRQPTPAPTAASSPAPATSEILRLDAASIAADWRSAAGTWQATEAGYAQVETERYDLATLLQRRVSGDYRFRADVKYVAGSMGGGLIFNAPDGAAKNGAAMVSYAENGNFLQWGGFDQQGAFKFAGGSPVAGGGDGAWHTLAVTVTGERYAVSLDGVELVRDVPLAPAAEGYVGLFASTSHVVFRNVSLEQIAP